MRGALSFLELLGHGLTHDGRLIKKPRPLPFLDLRTDSGVGRVVHLRWVFMESKSVRNKTEWAYGPKALLCAIFEFG
jgi:hypothetical protein